MNLTGLLSCVLTVLGSMADTTSDIIIFSVLVAALKRLGFSMPAMLVKLMKATAADPKAQQQKLYYC